jgi:hypothetical protein
VRLTLLVTVCAGGRWKRHRTCESIRASRTKRSRVLGALPGVVRTQIIHDDRKNHREGTMGYVNPLRDQVIVIHRRMWDEPEPVR